MEIGLGTGFAEGDVAGSDEIFRDEESGGAETDLGEWAGGRSNDGKRRRGENIQQRNGAGQGEDV